MGLEYSLAEVGTVFPASTIIYGNTTSSVAAKTHCKTQLGTGISLASVVSLSAMLVCRVFRDAAGAGLADSYTGDAALLEIDFSL